MKAIEKVNNNEDTTVLKKERGHSSRTRKKLIEQAIEACAPEDRFNTYKVCEQLGRIMEERYKDNTLEYQAERMGMPTTLKMMAQIDLYFYKKR